MPGEAGLDEAARLEAALGRIARAAAARRRRAELPDGAGQATSAGEAGPETAEIAARLDALIEEVRAALGTIGP